MEHNVENLITLSTLTKYIGTEVMQAGVEIGPLVATIAAFWPTHNLKANEPRAIESWEFYLKHIRT